MSHQRLIDQSEFALSLVSRLSGYVMLFFVFFFLLEAPMTLRQ